MTQSKPYRNVLVAVDTESGTDCWNYALNEIYRPGDVIHLVHVAATAPPGDVVLHCAPGTTYAIPGGVLEPNGSLPKVEAWLDRIYVQVSGFGWLGELCMACDGLQQ